MDFFSTYVIDTSLEMRAEKCYINVIQVLVDKGNYMKFQVHQLRCREPAQATLKRTILGCPITAVTFPVFAYASNAAMQFIA